jgi:hypothetical protein
MGSLVLARHIDSKREIMIPIRDQDYDHDMQPLICVCTTLIQHHHWR